MPGATAFTRIGASSTASVRVSEFIAPHTLAGSASPVMGRSATVPDVSVIDPPERMLDAAACTAVNAPK